MSTKYEDNFGFYCIDDDDPEELEFFCHIRAQSAPTICARCNQKVRLLEHIKICATCAEALEYGAPSDPAWVVPNLWSVVRRGVRSYARHSRKPRNVQKGIRKWEEHIG
jgi:hypothetical protein